MYRALYGERGLWVRPAKMFFETIERDGKKMKRFELVEIDKKHGFEECQPYYEDPMPDVIDMRLGVGDPSQSFANRDAYGIQSEIQDARGIRRSRDVRGRRCFDGALV